MTKLYEQLSERPRTNVNRGLLAPEERFELRTLRITRSSDVPAEYSGSWTTVYYLAGDDRRAAKVFVEENREQLEAIDFSNPDALSTSLPREAYDWVLHFLGERELRKYRTIIYERRPDGIEWVIERERFETQPMRRYSTSEETSVRVDASISTEELYAEFESPIRHYDLRDHPAVEGSVRWLLEYFRISGRFDCVPTTFGEWPAIEKRGG
ncbi:hypothetical protein [Natrarchaeobaculum sulfurireducens]|uniref:Uncharacterized protein n=1 Tax=Natrarchaeobaculum sulfurireducens TaxID=2044521 RepID=A0A346PN78_9EURY|nr:hypothetical protein [Natrarchaeobaculum sulfurireducens]AXR80973.1 hypothetical protein AArcMg_0955 [Natrarchaeobaculum sulfurireducens]